MIIILAGLPTAVQPEGIFFVTTAPAPTSSYFTSYHTASPNTYCVSSSDAIGRGIKHI